MLKKSVVTVKTVEKTNKNKFDYNQNISKTNNENLKLKQTETMKVLIACKRFTVHAVTLVQYNNNINNSTITITNSTRS